LAWLIDP